ncbi:MAG: hypothetical protein V4621_04650 [Pseudomonadota bacterium]
MLISTQTSSRAMLPVLYNGERPYDVPRNTAQDKAVRSNDNTPFFMPPAEERLEVYAANGQASGSISRSVVPLRGLAVNFYI